MTKRLLVCCLSLVLFAGISLASDMGKEGSWTGWVTDTMCGGEKGATAKHADCAKKCAESGHAKWALYNPADKKVYTLDSKEKLTAHAGHFVKVTGSVAGDTITVKSIEMAPEPMAGAAKPKS